jgi:tRNA(fMet)-specific endonuclease VapC
VLVPATTLGELELGFAGGANRQANQHALALFLADSSVEIVPIDHEIARTYGRIMHTLRRAGTPVPTNDAWIAACAETTSSVVLTFDRHFSLIASVRSLVLARDAGT